MPVGFADKILFVQKSVTLSYYNYVKELMGKQELGVGGLSSYKKSKLNVKLREKFSILNLKTKNTKIIDEIDEEMLWGN